MYNSKCTEDVHQNTTTKQEDKNHETRIQNQDQRKR
nr:MAG TPA: hypothetical protein [Caudoviricetes sp.]